MKKIALICIVVVFAACGSPEKTAQKLVKDYLKENLKDPSSYLPAEFGHLDSLLKTVSGVRKENMTLQCLRMILRHRGLLLKK